MAPLANSQPNRTSKGETLELLFLELNGNYIAEQVLFSVQQWRQDGVGCVRTIKETLGNIK